MASRFFHQRGFLILTLYLFCSVFVEIIGQEQNEANQCEPGTQANELISRAGKLSLFCQDLSQCLGQGVATCPDVWMASCSSTSYVGALRYDGVSNIGAEKYSVKCCQHPAITSAKVMAVTNKYLRADDSMLTQIRGGTVQIISNCYAAEGGLHIIQLSKIICQK